MLVVAGGARGRLSFVGPPLFAPASLRGRAVGGRAVLKHGAAWGRVLLHPFGALRGQHLGGRHFVRRCVPSRQTEMRGGGVILKIKDMLMKTSDLWEDV